MDEPKSTTDNPEELMACDPDTAWWNEVEGAIEADRDADDQWCREVEIQMLTDTASEATCTASEPEARISGSKRDPEAFQCTAGAKRPRRPG